MKYLLTATAVATALAGCSKQVATRSSFDRVAGSQLETGTFGNATMNNMLIQSGAQDYTVSLQNRFAAEVPDTITFEFNSARITPQGQDILRRQASWIKQFPEVRFSVYGNTDLVGSQSYNHRLGLRRARSVVNFLVSQGIKRDRLEALVSYGETRPVVQTQSPEMRNRRTVTEVSGFVENHPAVLNGKYAEVVFREYVNSAAPKSELRTFGESEVGAAEGN